MRQEIITAPFSKIPTTELIKFANNSRHLTQAQRQSLIEIANHKQKK